MMVNCGEVLKWNKKEDNLFAILFMHGNIEHLIIQYDFLSRTFMKPRHEYSIPDIHGNLIASIDICSLRFRQVWEIKPAHLSGTAVAEAKWYASLANKTCRGMGSKWVPGVHYKASGKWLEGYSREDCVFSFVYRNDRYDLMSVQKIGEPGAIGYHWEKKGKKIDSKEADFKFRSAVYDELGAIAAKSNELAAKSTHIDPVHAPRPIGSIIKIDRPTTTEELVQTAKWAGVNLADVPASGYLLPHREVPKIEQIHKGVEPAKDILQDFMVNAVTSNVANGEQVAVAVDEGFFDPMEGRWVGGFGGGFGAREDRHSSQGDSIVSWWGGLSTWDRTWIIVGGVLVLAAAVSTGLALVPALTGTALVTGGTASVIEVSGVAAATGGAQVISITSASTMAATTTAGASKAAMAAAVMLGISGSVGVMGVGIRAAEASTLPPVNPVTQSVGMSMNVNMCRYPIIPIDTVVPGFVMPRSDGSSMETTMPKFFVTNDSLSIGDPLVVGADRCRVIALSQRAQ